MLKQPQTAFLSAIFLFLGLTTNTLAAEEHTTSIKIFKHSWLAHALKLQREIDLNTPLNEAVFLGTHNSYNSQSYAAPFRYIDPNQTLSLFDQLEAGIRSIELDPHWSTNNHLVKDILLCHAQESHTGCSLFDRPITEGLQELRDWLQTHPNEIVLLYLDRHLDGHEPRLAALFEEYLGKFIYQPSMTRKNNQDIYACVALPSTSLTKADILKAGKQLLIVTKSCDGNNPHYQEQDKFKQQWNDYVFAGIGDIPTLPFTFIDATITHFSADDCGQSTLFSPDIHHTSMWRIFEDRTTLTNIIHKEKKLEDDEMRKLAHCGINWLAIDNLTIADSRLAAAIWSWAQTYPQPEQGQCAINKKSEGIKNIPCDKTIAGYACQEIKTRQIKALSLAGIWSNGESSCQLFAGKNWHFVTPVNGSQMRALNESMNSLALQEVWLNYTADKNGYWTANKN